MSGVVAVAHAVRLADVDVISSYPIRPYTGVMSELARMIADGELDAELLHAEGEHGQLSIAFGAAPARPRSLGAPEWESPTPLRRIRPYPASGFRSSA